MCWNISILHGYCLATVGVCVFRALASAGAFFILRRFYMNDLKFRVYIGENMVQGQHKSDITIENVILFLVEIIKCFIINGRLKNLNND